MPAAFPPTMAEREAELIALQSAFDEYIASSRELEEELDGELAKMQEKLAESTAANSVLSAQLENIGPQLASLENALTEARRKLKEEQKLRRAAEQAQDEADQRVREMEMALQTVREECDEVHEELAFRENELEETRLELEVEKQQLQNELAAVQKQFQDAERKAVVNGSSSSVSRSVGSDAAAAGSVPSTAAADAIAADDAYVKKLEEELELVTEQLIETEKRLSDAEADLQEQRKLVDSLRQEGRREEDEDLINRLQTEASDLKAVEQKIRDELNMVTDELALSKEEVALQQEELQAAEEDLKAAALRLDEEKAKHREAINQLSIQVKEAEVSSKKSLGEAALVAATVKSANEENDQLLEQIAALESALQNSKDDYQNVLDELDAVNARFDEVRAEAELAGRETAAEELRAVMKADSEHEIKQIKEQLSRLIDENKALQTKIDETEMALAAAKDSHAMNGGSEGPSEQVIQLQVQLTRAKDEVAKKDREMSVLTMSMQERLATAEENVSRLEIELSAAKGKLAEAEARLIVLRGEKERSEKAITSKSPDRGRSDQRKSPKERSQSIDREELASMDNDPSYPAWGSLTGKTRSRSTSPSSVMRIEYRLQEEQRKYKDLQTEYDLLKDQKRMGEARVKRLEDDLRTLQKELFTHTGGTAVVTQMSRLSALASKEKDIDALTADDVAGKRVDEIIESKDFALITKELKSLEKKCNSQREYNAQLLSKMLHLQGNIQVYCRVRPMSLNEIKHGAKNVVESLSETEIGCFDSRSNKWKSFAFDRVWGPDQSQQSVFQDVEPLALSVVDGFNACIFAYGQTGSGKTYTMEGVPDNNQYGISYRTIQKIFHLLNLRAQQQRAAEMFVGSGSDDEPAKEVAFTFSIEIGMLEIYNEEIYDLLATEGSTLAEKKQGAMQVGGKASLDIRRSKEGRVEVPNLVKEQVSTIEEVMQLLKRGNSNRATAATDMNEHSSRSHMVLMVEVSSGLDEAQRNKGTLYLVDLAGSERVRKSNVEGDQLKEAGFINKSLSALGNVMEALDRKASHVPYRDSKLTYMLQDSVGGNSRTMMVVTICPNDHSYDESVHALHFATRVRRIQIGAAQRNVTSKNLEETVKSLTEEMRNLTRAKERTESQLHNLKRDNARVQEKLQSLSKSKTQNRAEHKTLEVLKKNNDEMAARWEKEKTAREETSDELEKARGELRTLQQQLGKAKSKMQVLEQKLEDKENDLEVAKKQLLKERNDRSAATVRARRDQVLNTRQPAVVSRQAASEPVVAIRPLQPMLSAPPTSSSAVTAMATPIKRDDKVSDPVETPMREGSIVPQATPTTENTGIRAQVLALLEKHDKAKVGRIDIIMEKFEGKEELLLEKMTQRYEGDSASPAVSVQKRNEMALQRHQERMQRLREKKAGGAK